MTLRIDGFLRRGGVLPKVSCGGCKHSLLLTENPGHLFRAASDESFSEKNSSPDADRGKCQLTYYVSAEMVTVNSELKQHSQPYQPKFVEQLYKCSGSQSEKLRPLSELCGKAYGESLRLLRKCHERLRRPRLLLRIEEEDFKQIHPWSMLLSIGRMPILNFNWKAPSTARTDPLLSWVPMRTTLTKVSCDGGYPLNTQLTHHGLLYHSFLSRLYFAPQYVPSSSS